jgi:valyl-tRNA synthetase
MSSTQDVRYSAEKIRQGQALANKLFNASRFVLLNIREDAEAAPRPQTVEDRWILSRLERAKADAARRIGEFDFAKLSLGLYDFVYGELCDWYLELVKGREFDESLSSTMLVVLRDTLGLAHPVIPFVTEEIWSHIPSRPPAEGLLAQARRGEVRGDLFDAEAEATVGGLIDTVRAVRAWRDTAGIAPGERLVARADGFDEVRDPLARLARLEWGDPGAEAVSVGGVELAVPAVDVEALERKRAEERARLQAEIDRAAAKLENQGFVAKAPPEVVQAERDKLADLQSRLEAA